MSLLIGLLLVQAAPVQESAPERSPELDAANDCLVAGARQSLEDKSIAPDAKESWRWAQVIVERCKPEIDASVPARPSENGLVMSLLRQGATVNISRYDLRRSEALYYVDGMIRAHFEKGAE
ncbi:MAG: hypothetical protein AAF127_05315 [Pseudomonadota bacterium]